MGSSVAEHDIVRAWHDLQQNDRVISTLHTVKFEDRGSADFGKPGNYFEHQISRWSKQYMASMTQPIIEMEKLMAWLPHHIPPVALAERMVSLVQGYYRLDNLMFTPPNQASWPCWTGSCQRWGIPWLISAITAWPGTFSPGCFAA